jgi:hypothetical protein
MSAETRATWLERSPRDAPGGVLLARRPHRRREEHEQKAVRNLKIDKDFLFGVRLISNIMLTRKSE